MQVGNRKFRRFTLMETKPSPDDGRKGNVAKVLRIPWSEPSVQVSGLYAAQGHHV